MSDPGPQHPTPKGLVPDEPPLHPSMFRTNFGSNLAFRDHVIVDHATVDTVTGYVTGFCWKDTEGHQVEVSFMRAGAACHEWVHEWRLTKA